MHAPQVAQVLKSDSFGRVELLQGPEGPVVRRVACGGRVPGSRWLAGVLLRREVRALDRLAGVAGVAQRLDLSDYASAPAEPGASMGPVVLRSWIEGIPLWRVQSLPFDFFERLEDLVRELHARGVCHNDLHKEPNVLVDHRGYPALVDFQLASLHRPESRALRVRAEEDLRHVEKHRRVYARGTGRVFSSSSEPLGHGDSRESADRPRERKRRSWIARLWMRFGKPVYNFITRRILKYRDGEPRRPSTGPWPVWTPAVGPRHRSSLEPDAGEPAARAPFMESPTSP